MIWLPDFKARQCKLLGCLIIGATWKPGKKTSCMVDFIISMTFTTQISHSYQCHVRLLFRIHYHELFPLNLFINGPSRYFARQFSVNSRVLDFKGFQAFLKLWLSQSFTTQTIKILTLIILQSALFYKRCGIPARCLFPLHVITHHWRGYLHENF